MTNRNRPVRAWSPWRANTTGEVRYERPTPRQLALYLCQRGHEFTVTFAAEVTAPAEWECRCGAPAGPAAAAGGDSQHERRMSQLLGRRSRAELETMLAGRLAPLDPHRQERL